MMLLCHDTLRILLLRATWGVRNGNLAGQDETRSPRVMCGLSLDYVSYHLDQK
jgi:hypothetical protein